LWSRRSCIHRTGNIHRLSEWSRSIFVLVQKAGHLQSTITPKKGGRSPEALSISGRWYIACRQGCIHGAWSLVDPSSTAAGDGWKWPWTVDWAALT
jgi:hypothetical protein